MGSKQEFMRISKNNLPSDVLKILEQHSNTRSLTPYIIECVRNNQQQDNITLSLQQLNISNNDILERIKHLEKKIDNLGNNSSNLPAEETTKMKEGQLFDTDNLVGGMSKDDLIDGDF